MYKFLFVLSIVMLTACDDGNFEIPSFEFNENIQTCGNYVLYRTNTEQTEALIIQLAPEDITSEVTVTPIEIPITENNVQYRIFNDVIGLNYFCSDIPPVTPIVIRTWLGVQATENFISISTLEVRNIDEELVGYEHQITLHNLVLESNGDTQVYETYYFGSFVTDL